MPNRRKRCSPLKEAGKWLLKREDPPGFEVADYGHKGKCYNFMHNMNIILM